MQQICLQKETKMPHSNYSAYPKLNHPQSSQPNTCKAVNVTNTRTHPKFYKEEIHSHVGRDSSVGIATRYGLDGPGIEFRWGRHFTHPSRPALGPTQPPIQWVPGLSRGQSGRGVALTTHPHLAPRLKEE